LSTLKAINVVHPSGTVTNIVNDNAGNITVGNNLTVTGTATINGVAPITVAPGTSGNLLTSNGTAWVSNTPTLSGLNRLINGDLAVDQRNSGAAQTITAGAALAYTVDRFYAYCTGANVTGQQIAGATANQYRYQFTGAASVTAINFAQRIEALNSADLAGTTATFSVDMANSLLTTVTWTAYYANTTNTFGTLASPTVTSISTGTFTVSSTVTRYNVQIAIPSAATTGLQIVLSVGAQTSGTWTIGNVQLEAGSIATPYERQIYSDQLAQCQRYLYVPATVPGGFNGSGTFTCTAFCPVSLRAIPTISYSGTVTCTGLGINSYTSTTQPSSISLNGTSQTVVTFSITGLGATAVSGYGPASGVNFLISAEL